MKGLRHGFANARGGHALRDLTSCGGRKIRFLTERRAWDRVRELTEKNLHQPDRGWLRPYLCSCGWWHLGHKEDRVPLREQAGE